MKINTQKMYDNVMHKFKWGGMEKPGLYIDEKAMNMCKSQRGAIFADLAYALMAENKIDSAIKVLDRCVEVMPEENVPFEESARHLAYLYFQLGEKEKAKKIATSIFDYYNSNIDWMLRLRPSQRDMQLLNSYLSLFNELLEYSSQFDNEFAEKYSAQFSNYMEKYKSIFPRE